jgi:hypothetical protein
MKDKPVVDWRCRVTTTLEKECKNPYTGKIYNKGAPVSLSTSIKHKDHVIDIADPSAPALLLNQSIIAYNNALTIHPFLIDSKPSVGEDISPRVFDFLELMMASIIFAYSSLEAFANEEIPENYNYETTRNRSALLVVLRKSSIERNINLDEKLSIILPQVKKVNSPKGTRIWNEYVELGRIRDRIIHMKSADRIHSTWNNHYPNTLWSYLCNPKSINYPLVSKNLFLHFKKIDETSWLKYCPI